MNEGRSLDNTQIREIVQKHITTLNEKIDQWHKDLPALKTSLALEYQQQKLTEYEAQLTLLYEVQESFNLAIKEWGYELS
jgi:hypothetical protein